MRADSSAGTNTGSSKQAPAKFIVESSCLGSLCLGHRAEVRGVNSNMDFLVFLPDPGVMSNRPSAGVSVGRPD